MKLDLYQRVVVTQDFPDQQLKAGDIRWLIDYARDPKGGEDGAILEMFDAVGAANHIAIDPESAIEALPKENR